MISHGTPPRRLWHRRQADLLPNDRFPAVNSLRPPAGFASRRLKTTPSRLEIEQLDAPLALAFLQHLETTRHNSAGTRNVRLAAIKSFAHYMEYRVPSALEQLSRILAVPMKKTDTRLVKHLSMQEIQALLDAPHPVDWAGIRDRALLHAHMQTTEIYTRADPSIRLEALNAATAPNLRSGRFRASDKLIASLSTRSVMRSKKPAR